MDRNKILDEIFNSDPMGLLDVKPKKSSAPNADERLIASFQEISHFFEKHNREPQPNIENPSEYQLYCRLKNLREDGDKVMLCESHDKYSLLKTEKKELKSIEDVFEDDSLDLLDSDSEGLFDFKHTPKETNMPDYVACRKPCKDFVTYEPLFIQCQVDLKNDKRRLYPFKNEQDITEGHFFVLKGVLLYVAHVGEKSNEKGKVNARLRCVFENGTESDMLLRSLSAELYKNGRRVSENENGLLGRLNDINEEDDEAGFIYVLKSLSSNPNIQNIQNLYKIGYSNTPVEERIKNAEQEPTYLMAPVKIISTYKCYNLNPQKLEQLIHNFFGKTCLNFDIFDKNGTRHTPREWFIAPLDAIEQAIEFIISGEIVDYRYDTERQIIVGK
ncbi:GIY-YIG nuclease family protein [Methanosarcina mazei]|uniref:Bacteriophage T5 Orf172 DNA-binding domain-containing protein n=1 Tax=Methanosarcina mazei TaxID=2209 RepID=A0A0F8GX83_METMZ|nr:GIY-YIG nuclease family protein [Methanosarcina mazei]KKG68926.1 hypothetical protein DU46_00590 [Methanosarcina mazei]KKG78415.1 hypothetical protein DU61_00040 [Methanosarcina mazei]KKH06364.1 hypothetical protein DU62_17485 [Methanosarcina mazei]KKH08822.1 hypothetical protein DU51_19125 [Methanosarcina mazei]